jgi:NitT/TauT family transport system permease protein
MVSALGGVQVDPQTPALRSDGPKKRSRTHEFLLVWSLRLVLLAAVIGLWQVLADNGTLNPIFTGTPGGIAKSFVDQFSTTIVSTDLPTTLEETMIGFLISSAAGILIAFALNEMPLLYRVVRPGIAALNSVPRIALAPIFILWFGLGQSSKVALIVAFVFFIVLVNATAAFENTDQDRSLLARSLGFNRRQILLKFVMPAAIPVLASTLELALTYSFLGSVTGEMLGGYQGLGVQLQSKANSFETNDYFAILLLVVIMTVVLVGLMHAVRQRLWKWYAIESRGSH